MKPIRFSLKLKEGKAPHLYISDIKKLIENDKTLHPQMEQTLKLLKKRRQPFIELATLKELVFDVKNYRHFERSIEPRKIGWLKTYWSIEEQEQCDKDPEAHVKFILQSMEKIGYEFFNPVQCTDDFIEYLESMTIKQKRPEGIDRQ